MKKLLFLPLLLLANLLAPAQSTVRALFLGNSYTFYNSLPDLVANLALSGGDTLVHASNTPGGYTLQGHSTNANSLSLISQGTWDYVVLQEQSQRPSFPPSQVASQVLPFAAILADSIRAANPCAEPVYFMTWGRKNGDASNCASYPPLCTYAGMQDRLRSSYLLMGTNNQATVAPVGAAWWQSILQDPNLELYSPDQSHPSYNGSYLAACVFYGTLFRKSPAGLAYHGSLDSATATYLQNVAQLAVFDSLPQWRIGANDLAANFNYNALSNGEVSFTNTSSFGATAASVAYDWDFGDGANSTAANPVHTYASNGQYVVTLAMGDGCQADTMRDTLAVAIVGVEKEAQQAFQVHPNPNTGLFAVTRGEGLAWEDGVKLELWSLNGQMLRSIPLLGSGSQVEIDLRQESKGLYFIRLVTSAGTSMRRVLVQ